MKGRALLTWLSYEENGGQIYMTLSERLRSWGTKAMNPSRFRWERCLKLIR